MDSDKSIRNFLGQADRLAQLLLVTGNEVEELYGEEVAAALAKLEGIDREEQLCSNCGGKCCRDIGCELYDSRFDRCPVYDFRPLACRFHFCNRFYIREKELVAGLRDLFLSSSLALSNWDSDKWRAMDSPPLAGVFPELVAVLSHRVGEVQQGELAPELAGELIRRKAEAFRITRKSGR